MSTQKHFVVLAILVLAAAALDAQGTATLVRQRQSVSFAEPLRRANTEASSETRIIGQVIDIRQIPVAHVQLRLRNLLDGTVGQRAESNENGEHAYLIDEHGTYVDE